MNVPTRMKKILFRLALSLACVFAWSAHAQTYRASAIDQDPRGNIIARILASFTAHAEPAGRWYRDALAGRQVNTLEFEQFGRQLETATFVSATYEFQRNRLRERRVYHARSGRNDLVTGLRAAHRPRLRSYRSYFPSGSDAVVAWDQPAPSESVVTNRPVQGDTYQDARKRDAELKIARQLEADIRAGRVADGGRLNLYSSQEPCDSCREALVALTRTTRVRVHVAFLRRERPAYRNFHRQREEHLSSIHVAANGGQTNVIRAEEPRAGATSGEEVCEEAAECD